MDEVGHGILLWLAQRCDHESTTFNEVPVSSIDSPVEGHYSFQWGHSTNLFEQSQMQCSIVRDNTVTMCMSVFIPAMDVYCSAGLNT